MSDRYGIIGAPPYPVLQAGFLRQGLRAYAVQVDGPSGPVGVFTDPFTRADSATTMGSPWVAYWGTWGISTDTAYQAVDGGGDHQNVVAMDTGTYDDFVSVDLPTVGSDCGVVTRLTDKDNYWMAALTGTTFQIYKKDTGSFTFFNPFTTSGSHTSIAIATNGKQIDGYLDGVKRSSTSNIFNQTATKKGLRSFNTDATRFDNFKTTGIPQAQYGMYDVISGRRGVLMAGGGGTFPDQPRIRPTEWGRAMEFLATSKAATFANRGYKSAYPNYLTLFWVGRLLDTSTNGRYVSTSFTDNGLTLARNPAMSLLKGSVTYVNSTINVNANTPIVMAICWRKSDGFTQFYLMTEQALGGTPWFQSYSITQGSAPSTGDGIFTVNAVTSEASAAQVALTGLSEQFWSMATFRDFCADPFAIIRTTSLKKISTAKHGAFGGVGHKRLHVGFPFVSQHNPHPMSPFSSSIF